MMIKSFKKKRLKKNWLCVGVTMKKLMYQCAVVVTDDSKSSRHRNQAFDILFSIFLFFSVFQFLF